ncbi:M14 family metallopeptidase [Isosphaeraceae bacterium EP7]
MDTASFYSSDYETARSRFREAAADAGLALMSYPIDGAGPDGIELTIDVAVRESAGSDQALVISSGVHGVEGPVGSAVQLALLRDWVGPKAEPPSVRVVLLHGLNPYGFAWRRRFNEQNVDLNRNLLLEGESFSGSPPGYAELDGLLNPKRSPRRWEPVTLKFFAAIFRHGIPALKQAVASGQYDFPRGIFYGGDGPSAANRILSAEFDGWLGDSRQVVHLDFHTGLGAWAKCRLLIDYPLSESKREQLGRWFGPDSFEATDPNKTAFAVRGSFGRWCVAQNRGRDYLYAAAEFGTYKPTRILAGLREENQAHHWGRATDTATKRAKQRLAELFCPGSESWRSEVLDHGKRLVKLAINGLVGGSNPMAAMNDA